MNEQPTPQRHVISVSDRIAVIVAIVFPSLVTWVYFVAMADEDSVLQQASYLVGKCLQFGMPVLWVWKMAPRKARTSQVSRGDLLLGVLFGGLATAAGYLLFATVLRPAGLFTMAQPVIEARVSGLGISTLWQYVMLALFYAFCHSFLEEYYWRWFVFAELRRTVSVSAAVVISAAGFAAHHVIVLAQFFGWTSPATFLFALAVAVGGAFWAWLYERCGSLLAPWLSHLIIDAGIFLIGYQLISPLQ
jgi:membrane protease YdiL (CAAX protease family)